MSAGYGGGKAVQPQLLVGSLGMFEPDVSSSSFDEAPMFAASYPGAMHMKKRFDAPAAPSRKPSLVEWEVPPLELPTAPKRKSTAGIKSPEVKPLEAFDLDAEPASEEEDDEEGCVFSLDGGAGGGDADEDEGFGGALQFRLAGLDDGDQDDLGPLSSLDVIEGGSPKSPKLLSSSIPGSSSEAQRNRSESMSPVLGASPTLLSALELVAAEAGSVGKTRHRIGTV
eukprot:gb/GFBE01074312.1/.p1 GENE.gb/GFBE01074312.1/~~gb/GFBE01074312.1/.p1  ORF type:complete len:226 (+),score=51.74 gb/GFBE01074312.1/:1-678(+)